MQNLRASIEILYRNIDPDSILEKYLSDFRHGITLSDFVQQAFELLQNYSHDEIKNLYSKIFDDWGRDPSNNISSVFNLAYNFTSSVLTEQEGIPKVRFQHLLRWRDISHKIGEDFFTCIFLAYRDKFQCKERSFFAWRPVIDSDNSRLKTLLSKGLAENHFHLFGSAPYCELSWISLMNDIRGRLPQFKKIFKAGLLQQSDQVAETINYRLYFLTIKAAIIRAHLFSILKHKTSVIEESGLLINDLLRGPSEKSSSEYLASSINKIQDSINLLRFMHGLEYVDRSVCDYAIDKSVDKSNNVNILLSGERWLLYNLFKISQEINIQNTLSPGNSLLYAYLLCKNKFREEMIQVNNKTGFSNFHSYQDRKDLFLSDKKVYSEAMTNMAIYSSRNNQHIISFEARVSHPYIKKIPRIDATIADPEYTSKNISKIIDVNNAIVKSPHFYVVHFIKKEEKHKKDKFILMQLPRHHSLRKLVKEQALALNNLREFGPGRTATRIRGIDAASNELYTRPEVFASSFRFLKYYQRDNKYSELRTYLNHEPLRQLMLTYHVGEDFFDIVDGLRAIDEAIKFLELGDGDRIGHALALGINVKDYYLYKKQQLLISKQNLLDNYAWLLSRIVKYGLNELLPVKSSIENEFRVLFEKVYKGLGLKNDPVNYYQAWTLRGDDPLLYQTGSFRNNLNSFSDMHPFLTGRYGNEVYRNSSDAATLYFAYHYNDQVKTIGNEIVRFDVSNAYINAVGIIQKYMQREVAEKHIAIECNPSSNVLIGTFKRYDKHPIVNFFNLGLCVDPAILMNCPQLMVSINTDDQGVFNTYLENEYAFLAKALEKARDQDGNPIYNMSMIYDWLERIRNMGLEMSFR
jgi:adenosine deaminase